MPSGNDTGSDAMYVHARIFPRALTTAYHPPQGHNISTTLRQCLVNDRAVLATKYRCDFPITILPRTSNSTLLHASSMRNVNLAPQISADASGSRQVWALIVASLCYFRHPYFKFARLGGIPRWISHDMS